MPSQLKLSDILNILSIGIIFQLMILFFIYKLDSHSVILTKITKLDSTLTTGLALIFSFPSWRIVSNFVENIMYPPSKIYLKEKKYGTNSHGVLGKVEIIVKATFTIILFRFKQLIRFVKLSYRFVFFNLGFSDGVYLDNLAKNLKENPNDENNKLMISNFRKLFSIDIQNVPDKDLFKIYYLCKSYLTTNKDVYDNLFSVRYNTVLNYHTRLATLSNIFTIGCFTILVKDFSFFNASISVASFLKSNLIFYLCILSILCSRWFGGYCRLYSKRESELMVYDFNALAIIHDCNTEDLK